MALKVLLLRKKLEDKRKTAEALRAKLAAFAKREGEIAQAIAEAETDEEKAAVEEMVEEVETQQTETKDALTVIDEEITQLISDIEELEAKAAEETGEPPAEDDPPAEEEARSANKKTTKGRSLMFRSRSQCFTNREAMTSFYGRSDVHEFLDRVRGAANQRGVTGAQLSIPVVMLDLIRENLGEYSKLINRVRFQSVRGSARVNVLGKVPEGVWTEMVADLNELEFAFTQIEMDGFEVGGYIPVPNAYLKDSDINLGEEIMTALLRAVGYALDKAIVYGKGNASKMPVGIVTRLAQSSQPSYWGANQGAWTDLHSTHILKLNLDAVTGTGFFQPIMAAMGKAEPDYSASQRPIWLMNRNTHMDVVGRGLTFDAAGALVAGLSDTMPVIGGDIVELDFLPDKEIIGGFGDCYLLVEREGAYVAQSEHVFFLKNQTVYKGCARYDGQPVVGEAFVALNYANQDVTTEVNFAVDYANTKMNVLICTAAASSTAAGKTVVTVSGTVADSPTLKYALKVGEALVVGDKLPGTGWTDLTSGTTEITAAAGTPITVVELDSASRVISSGTVVSVPKAS